MVLRSKSILQPIEAHDGTRVSVMSRHTLNDGITPHPQITDEMYDYHMDSLAPPAKLLGDYYKRGLSWQDFEEGYREFLNRDETIQAIECLSYLALNRTVTLLCIEEDDSFCHRRLLIEAIERVSQ